MTNVQHLINSLRGADVEVTPELLDALDLAIEMDERNEAAEAAEFDYAALIAEAAAAEAAEQAAKDAAITEQLNAFKNRFAVGNTVHIDGMLYVGNNVKAGVKGWGKIAQETTKAILVEFDAEDGGGAHWFPKSALLFDEYDGGLYSFDVASWFIEKINSK